MTKSAPARMAGDVRRYVPAPLALALLSALPALAQQQTTETVVITAPRLSPTSPDPAAVEAALKRTPGAVSVVPAERFADRYALNLKDMLTLTPGVYAQQRFAEEVRLSIRGSGLSRGFHGRGLQFLVDGVPINLADGAFDFQELDPTSLRHIEVYRGGNALRYGAASLGGAVNAVTATARTAGADNRLSLEGGDHGTLRATAAFGRRWDGVDALVHASAVHSDGWRDQSVQDSQRLSGNVGLDLGGGAETRFHIAANRIQQELPGTLTLTQALTVPRRAAPASLAGDQARDIRSLRLSNRTSLPLGEGRLDFGAFANRKELFHPIFQVVDQDSLDYGGFVRFSSGSDAVGESGLVAGANLRSGRTDAHQYVNQAGNRGALTALSVQKARNVELYAEGRLPVADTVALVAGGQGLLARRELGNRLVPSRSDARDESAFSPKLGLLWDINPDIQAWTNVTRSVEEATFSELVQAPLQRFVPLRLQEAWTWEAGTRGRSGPVTWDVTLYRAELDGEMLQYSVALDIPAATFNAGETVHQGLEAAAAVTLAEGMAAAGDSVRLSASWTLNDFHFVDDAQFGDNTLPAIPRNVVQGELRWGVADGSHLALGLEWVPQGAWVDYRNSLRAPGYAVWGLSGAWVLRPGLRLYGEMRNLLDRAHVTNFSTVVDAAAPGANLALFYPGGARSLQAGLKLEF